MAGEAMDVVQLLSLLNSMGIHSQDALLLIVLGLGVWKGYVRIEIGRPEKGKGHG